ncbi:hypothetical protein BU14_0104s0012 [Porphyra umbilicalis]|uniref:Uncharacterized protein n=1 Tax=Porphyra umbilicalis TaxID=2786 RepID=A0A1X6PCN6_PORUM|nr:hypothetical protein BU14_0104s0012 [Porphyra umbilicalis]|eukprot:OSX78638.1 hypothetical protein BU14_0104s0012 [Porphyra umbilicalis]
MEHTEVDFNNPTWLAAMQLCEEDETPERQAHKTTLSYFKSLQKTLEGGCSFEDEEGCQCGGNPVVKPSSTTRGAFVGCSDWKKGDPPTHSGGHMARWVPAGVDLDRLSKWLDSGVDELQPAGNCVFIAPKCTRELECKRHGGEFPDLVRSGSGACPNAISDASGGGQVSSSFTRKLRQKARATAHPFGQDILGITDLYRRAGSRHDYIRAILQKPDYTAVILQTDEQAAWSGKLRYIQADSTFGVVAPGSAKEGVPAEVIRNAGKRAFDWDLLIIAGPHM